MDDAIYTPTFVVVEGSHWYVHAPGLMLTDSERKAYIRWYLGE